MYVYFVVSSLALSTVIFPSRKYIAVCLVILALICAARDQVLGYDFSVYEGYFNNLPTAGNVFNYEPGYFWVNYIFSVNDYPFHLLLLCISLFYHVSLFFILINLSKEIGFNPGWLLFFYVTSGFYFWHGYTLLRQSFGISLFYLSVGLSFRKMMVLNLIGPAFHISSFINVFVVVFSKMKNFLSFKGIAVVFTVLILAASMLAGYFVETLEFYDSFEKATPLVFFETLLQAIFLLLLLPKNNYSFLIKIIVLVSILFCFFGVFVNEIFVRFLEPYKIFMFMSYAVILMRLNMANKFLYFSASLVFVLLSYARTYRFFDNFGDYAVPYMSIFD